MHSSFYTKCEWKEINDFDIFVFESLIQNIIESIKMSLDVSKNLILRYALLLYLFMCLLELKKIFIIDARCIMRKYYDILLLQRNLRYR